MMRLVFVCWSWFLPLAQPKVTADASATCRSLGLARADSQWTCGRDLDAQCAELGLERVREIDYGSTYCSEDEGLATCSITCSVVCSEPVGE